jgi:hypothetical protein
MDWLFHLGGTWAIVWRAASHDQLAQLAGLASD